MARVVLNLKQIRAEKSVNAPVIVDFDGVEHPIKRLNLDAFLDIMELDQEFDTMRKEEAEGTLDGARQLSMLSRLKDLVRVVLPGFPVGGLELDELMAVAQALQASVAPEKEDAEGDAPGE